MMPRYQENASRRRSRSAMRVVTVLLCSTSLSFGFQTLTTSVAAPKNEFTQHSSSTALNVWWFGGTEQNEVSSGDESCELVAVRIERTSANSRRIAGDISVPAKLEDVWSILTDYDRLSIHVPNLMESRITQRNSAGEPGDGSYKCRLYQKGAQKIIGFDFSASVTMDMTERIVSISNGVSGQDERTIGFKCVDSQFFSVFDGVWRVQEVLGADGNVETLCSYSVDVRPKGPVPVAALEWRIREDVPTNLRAVKAATMRINAPATLPIDSSMTLSPVPRGMAAQRKMVSMAGDWDRDETMAKYL